MLVNVRNEHGKSGKVEKLAENLVEKIWNRPLNVLTMQCQKEMTHIMAD